MTYDEQTLLDSLSQMECEAPNVGLCSMPFRVIREEVQKIIVERDNLAAYRRPTHVLPYHHYFGKCPSCGYIFERQDANYCIRCGKRVVFWDADKTDVETQ